MRESSDSGAKQRPSSVLWLRKFRALSLSLTRSTSQRSKFVSLKERAKEKSNAGMRCKSSNLYLGIRRVLALISSWFEFNLKWPQIEKSERSALTVWR